MNDYAKTNNEYCAIYGDLYLKRFNQSYNPCTCIDLKPRQAIEINE